MDDLPTPDELGERLKRGEITEGDAIEIMSQRARREALAGLYGPPPKPGDSPENGQSEDDSTRKAGKWILVAIVAALAILYILLQFLD